MMMDKLNLSEDQKAKIKVENEAFHKQVQEIRKNENVTVKDMKSKMESAHKDHKAKIENILTTEQKTQLSKLREEMKTKRENGMRERGDKMADKLNLTADQKAKMEKNRAEMKSKLDAIRNDKNLSDEARHEKMKEVMKSQKESLKSILTEEQLQKMKEQHKERGDRPSKNDKVGKDKSTI
jgi:Spy/CpxP family protein refolding chaperone